MDAKDYLDQYIEFKRKQRRLSEEYAREKESIEQLFSLCKVCFSAKQRRERERQLQSCSEYCDGLLVRAEEAEAEAEKIRSLVESISGLEEKVLYLRYVDGCTWEQVCERSFYSWNTVWRYHDRGLQLVQEMIDKAEASG